MRRTCSIKAIRGWAISSAFVFSTSACLVPVLGLVYLITAAIARRRFGIFFQKSALLILALFCALDVPALWLAAMGAGFSGNGVLLQMIIADAILSVFLFVFLIVLALMSSSADKVEGPEHTGLGDVTI